MDYLDKIFLLFFTVIHPSPYRMVKDEVDPHRPSTESFYTESRLNHVMILINLNVTEVRYPAFSRNFQFYRRDPMIQYKMIGSMRVAFILYHTVC